MTPRRIPLIALIAFISFVSFSVSAPSARAVTEATCIQTKGAGWECTTETAGKTCETGLCPGGADNKCCSTTAVVGSEQSSGPAAKRETTTRQLTNPLGSTSIPDIVGRIIQVFTGVSGSIALLMFVWGGVIWLTSGGSPEKVQQGKKIFTWAAIGLVIIFGSYALVNAIFGAIGAS